MTTRQRFLYGDHVMITTECCDAIVVASYHEQYGGGNTRDYTVYIQGRGEVSWFPAHHLTLLEPCREDLLGAWKREAGGVVRE